jgi:hypothetical protein
MFQISINLLATIGLISAIIGIVGVLCGLFMMGSKLEFSKFHNILCATTIVCLFIVVIDIVLLVVLLLPHILKTIWT